MTGTGIWPTGQPGIGTARLQRVVAQQSRTGKHRGGEAFVGNQGRSPEVDQLRLGVDDGQQAPGVLGTVDLPLRARPQLQLCRNSPTPRQPERDVTEVDQLITMAEEAAVEAPATTITVPR